MARGINKVILLGNIGQDPETRYMPAGGAVTNISVATSEQWKDKNTGQPQERTEWHRVVFFNRLAEIAGEYLKKGGKVYIEGSLRTRKWQGQDGQDRYTTEIVASEMQMLSDMQGNAGSPQQRPPQQQGYQQPPPQQQPHQGQWAGGHAQQSHQQQHSSPQAQQQPAQGYAAGGPPNAFDDFDDDVPFN